MVLAFLIMGIGVYDDVRHGPDPKFGYNYKNGLYWGITALVCIPVLNLIVAALLLWVHFPFKGRK